jgi:hypothetical protein
MSNLLNPGSLNPFSGGGISQNQADLGQFTYGQDAIKNAFDFSHGMGHSTGVTQADAGAGMHQALMDQQMSQADAAALTNFNNQQKSNLSSGISGIGGLLGSLGGI